jgi:hypothetical protein
MLPWLLLSVEIAPGATNNLVAGNTVGTDVYGTFAMPNFRGVYILGDQNTVGGTTGGARNLVSGNSGYGIEILGTYNQVAGFWHAHRRLRHPKRPGPGKRPRFNPVYDDVSLSLVAV